MIHPTVFRQKRYHTSGPEYPRLKAATPTIESSDTMRIRTASPAESSEPILSGHGAEQRSMERNYQSPARFRHAAAVVLPPRSISPDPSDYLLNISVVLVSISLPPSFSFLSFCPAPVCSSACPARRCAADRVHLHTALSYTRIYIRRVKEDNTYGIPIFKLILLRQKMHIKTIDFRRILEKHVCNVQLTKVSKI